MSLNLKILLSAGILVLIGIVAGYYFIFFKECPASCDDGNSCTIDFCSKSTDYKCETRPVPNCCGNKSCESPENYESCAIDCPNCDDNNNCTKESYDYHEKKCVNAPILTAVCCGNTVCEVNENYTTCARDCPNCSDDNKCTKDSYDYHKQKCLNEIIIPCCGNGICDKGVETRSNCSVDCPSCDDNNRLTSDSFNYTTQKCVNTVTHYFIEDFESGIQNWSFGGEGGTWSTIKEGSNTVLRGVGHNWAGLQNKEWKDYIFKTKFKIIKGFVHFNYRVKQEEGNTTRYFIGLGSGHVNISKQIRENFYSDLARADNVNLGSGWHIMEIRGYGNTLNVLVDGALLIKYTDETSPVLSGGITLETHDDSEYWIDDIEIKVIKQTDVVFP
ncbi:MAG: hypothetical protein Athens071424_97 [Parcubacteria group bacterium Athens0714_24]|nr:MAG: hypothetical protein Athens071424_97 [Parcubacteria group bacterium Athens0714_24]